jgi:exodeoxyribonuclease-3
MERPNNDGSDNNVGDSAGGRLIMRIVSYNILDGGDGRAEQLGQVIEAQRPDLVALVEADSVAVVEQIAGGLKMDYIRAEGEGHAVALLSRSAIVETINHGALGGKPRCLLEVLVREAGGREWVLGVTHFHARAYEADEVEREAEAASLLEVFARHRAAKTPHLLMGDFNANSPIQRIDPEKCKPKTREAWKANGDRIPRRVIGKLLEAGYVDTLHALHGEAAGSMGSFSTEFPGQRVDYVFAYGFGREALREAWIEQGHGAKEASDHFAVGVEVG